MTAQAPLGYFSEPGYTSIGDPYASTEGKVGGKTEKLARYYGKQFATAPPKKGQVYPGNIRALVFCVLVSLTCVPGFHAMHRQQRTYISPSSNGCSR